MAANEALRFHLHNEWEQLQKEVELLQSAIDLIEIGHPDSAKGNHNLSTIILMGTASAIEKSYSGMERILKIVAENIDDYVPRGDAWHKSLVDQMAADLDSRSHIIEPITAQGLHVLRAFRHRERNSYSLDLDKTRVLALGKQVFSVVENLKTDMLTLLDISLSNHSEDSDSLQKLPFNQDGYFDQQISGKQSANGDNTEII